MTLEEAHALQRRELMSLRAENKRLKKQASGSFPVEEKEALEQIKTRKPLPGVPAPRTFKDLGLPDIK